MGVRLMRRRAGRGTSHVAMLAALWTVFLPHAADAQTTGALPFADWRTRWSPLALDAADPAPLGIVAPAMSGLLLRPAPRVGLAWSAGQVAALAHEPAEDAAQFVGSYESGEGDFRRALMPSQTGAASLAGLGWRSIGGAGDASVAGRPVRQTMLAGRAALTSSRASGGTEALGLAPFGGSPLVAVDTATPDLMRTRAVMEGAIASTWRGWLGGIGAGIEVAEQTAARSGIARAARGSAPAAALGVGRVLWGERLAIAAQARWLGRAETVTALSNPRLTTLYELEGFDEPEPMSLTPQSPYRRRIVRDARAWSLAASGTLAGARWVLGGERSTLDEGQSSRGANDPPRDRWAVDANAIMAAVQRPLPVLGLTTVTARRASSSGAANRSDLSGTIITRERSDWSVDAEARRPDVPGARWGWALGGRIGGASDERRDGLLRVRSEIRTLSTAAWAEAARAAGERHAFALALGMSTYVPAAAIPDGETLGPVAQRLVVPTLEYESTGASMVRAGLTLRRRMSATGAQAWVQVGVQRATPWKDDAPSPLRPGGERTAMHVRLGTTLQP